jgi:hypothetical protein
MEHSGSAFFRTTGRRCSFPSRECERSVTRARRFYNQYEMPEGYATREITVRLHNSAEEEARRLNRAENLRAIPPVDPDFDRLYARRGDAESFNRNLEDSLYLKKAHSLGYLRQEADLLGFAQLVNSISLARHRASERLRPAA